jgi:hypothetical protein
VIIRLKLTAKRIHIIVPFMLTTAAEADWWYDQQATGKALQDFFTNSEDDLASSRTCKSENLQISTKIPPWSLTSVAEIRQSAGM